MPLNPLENMPEALRRQNIGGHKFPFISNEPQMNGNLNFGGPVMFASGGHSEKAQSPMNTLGKHGKVGMPTKYFNSFLPNKYLSSFLFYLKELCLAPAKKKKIFILRGPLVLSLYADLLHFYFGIKCVLH